IMIREICLKSIQCYNELYLIQLTTLNHITGKNSYGKRARRDGIICFYYVKKPAVLLTIQAFKKEMAEITKNKPFWVSKFHDIDTSQKISNGMLDKRSKVTETF
ncbi:hypothetical protein AAER89_29755, partial [Klebsiella pneumoniae]